MSCLRLAAGRILLTVALILALPAQWQASCGGWQSPQQAMACCEHASHDAEPSAASSCCAAQEQARHAQSPVCAMPAIQPMFATLPVPVVTPAAVRPASPRRARSVDSRLLASVFLI